MVEIFWVPASCSQMLLFNFSCSGCNKEAKIMWDCEIFSNFWVLGWSAMQEFLMTLIHYWLECVICLLFVRWFLLPFWALVSLLFGFQCYFVCLSIFMRERERDHGAKISFPVLIYEMCLPCIVIVLFFHCLMVRRYV